MRLVHMVLKDKDIDGIRQAALAVGALLFSGINVSVFSVFKPAGVIGILSAIMVSALSLNALFRLVQRMLLLAWASPVLGRWVYKSSSGNWGLATISIRGGELTYEVQLYMTESDTMAAVREEPGFVTNCFATVTSIGATYRGGQVELIYKVDRAHEHYPLRSGMLTLTPLSPNAMKGYWKSDIEGDEPKRGILDMWRPDRVRST